MVSVAPATPLEIGLGNFVRWYQGYHGMADATLPQLGETVTEGTITRWFKKVGDTVRAEVTRGGYANSIQ